MQEYSVTIAYLYTLIGISSGAGLLVGLVLALAIKPQTKNEAIKPPRKGLVDVAHLWRNKASGALVIQIEEQTLDVGQAVNPEQRQFLADLLADLSRWLGVQNAPVSVTPPPSPVVSAPPPAAASTPALPVAVPVAAPKPTAPPHEKAIDQKPSLPAEKPSLFNPMRSLRYVLENEASQKLEQQRVPPSIAAQVDEILQTKMKGTRFEQQGIRLMELPGKGMVVMVGMQQFDSIDSVTDPQVKILLKAAVSEWEKQMFRS
ncbi:MAG: hypothetical protein OHK0052_02030 [Anaerolineales bacterium]